MAAVALAFIGMDHTHDSILAANRWYTIIVVMIVYWVATFISLKGMGWTAKVSKIGGYAGTIVPVCILIVLAIIFLCTGGESQLDFSSSFWPDFSNFDNIVLAASIFLFYAGMEMNGVHVKDMDNPGRDYPKAVFLGSIVTVLVFVLGTYALAIIIPAKDINLVQSLLVGFDNYFNYFRIPWVGIIMAVALAFGVLAEVLTWVAGPSKGIYAVGKAGYLPPFFQKANKNGIQRNILMVQGCIVSLLSLLFVIMPSVQSFYQILSQLTVLLYLIMYILMFASGIKLRYSMKNANRMYRIGKRGNFWMWLVAGMGICGSLLAFILSFFPPGQITTGGRASWFLVLIIGVVVMVAIPVRLEERRVGKECG